MQDPFDNEDERKLNPNVRLIMEAIQNVQRANTRATKDGTNSFHGYDYVSEEGLVNQIRESFIENGLLLSPRAILPEGSVYNGLGKDANQHLVVWVQAFDLAHVSGAVWPFPLSVVCEGIDNGDKAVWKGLTNAHKHVLLKLLMLPTGEDPEADRGTDEAMAPQPRQAPRRSVPTSAARGGSQLPAPRKSTQGDQDAGSGREAGTSGVKGNPEDELSKEDFKNYRVWVMAFQAAERVYGKTLPEGISKFACMDDFKAEYGIGKGDPFTFTHLAQFEEYATPGNGDRSWHQFRQAGAGMESAEDTPF